MPFGWLLRPLRHGARRQWQWLLATATTSQPQPTTTVNRQRLLEDHGERLNDGAYVAGASLKHGG